MNVFQFLRGFGPVTSGGTPPAAPTLTVADNGDGTGAVATVAGDAGVTNRVYISPQIGTPGQLAFTLTGSRAGDGTIALALSDGAYFAQCVSYSGSLNSPPSKPYGFRVTGGAVAAASALALSKQKLITAISNSATFQAAVGVASAADALKAIYLAACLAKDEKEFASLRPFAVVGTAAELHYERDSGGTKNYLVASGAVYFYLAANDLDPTNPADSSVVWDNLLGGLIEDLEAVAALDDNLAIREMAIEGYGHSDEDRRQAQQPFWYALVRVEWGV